MSVCLHSSIVTVGAAKQTLLALREPTGMCKESLPRAMDYFCVLVIPKAAQKKKLHSRHKRLVWCHLRARSSVWWQGLNKQLTDSVHKKAE